MVGANLQSWIESYCREAETWSRGLCARCCQKQSSSTRPSPATNFSNFQPFSTIGNTTSPPRIYIETKFALRIKDYNKNLKPGFKKSLLPLRCIIKPSPWWTTMPKLQVGHTISVLGFLSHVLQQDDGKVQFFEVEVEQVNILGKTAVLTPVQFVDTSMPVFFLQTFFH